ncbi:MAG: hypothetical protein AB4058_00305 [Microcystaceae cyanobacterium]
MLRGLKLPDNWQFYKLVIVIAKGESGQIRIMYLVTDFEIVLGEVEELF